MLICFLKLSPKFDKLLNDMRGQISSEYTTNNQLLFYQINNCKKKNNKWHVFSNELQSSY